MITYRDVTHLNKVSAQNVLFSKVKRNEMTVAKMFRRNLESRADNVMFFDDINELTYR